MEQINNKTRNANINKNKQNKTNKEGEIPQWNKYNLKQ